MQYPPAHVANSFLYRANQEGLRDIDPLKLQKLVYYMNGWHLAIRKEPVVGEAFQAWPYGPVLSSLYHEFKKFGSAPIDSYAVEIDPSSGDPRSMMVNANDKSFYEVFDRVWNRYKVMSGLSLSALTHAPGTPWSKARQRGDLYLSNNEIRDHFIELAQSHQHGRER